jgi:hypothetical protein
MLAIALTPAARPCSLNRKDVLSMASSGSIRMEGKNSYDYIFDALPSTNMQADDMDPRRAAMRQASAGCRYILYGASQTLQ